MRAIRLSAVAFLALASISAGGSAVAQEGVMNNAGLDRLIRGIEGIEGEIEGRPGFWRFLYQGYQVYIITDENADRMRIMAPITGVEELGKDVLYRALQANFDTALDARYAIAKGALWSAFLHPLAALDAQQFQSGFAQTVTLAATFGTSFSSGKLQFDGGDKAAP
jgi:hypothetical protein